MASISSKLPTEILENVYAYLPEETVIQSAEVSKDWQMNLAKFRKEVGDAWKEKKYAKMFWECGIRISQLPRFKPSRRILINSSSMNLSPDDLSDPVMRNNRAILVKIEGISEGSILYSPPGPFSGIFFKEMPIKKLQSVLAIHKVGDHWKVAWSNDLAKSVYMASHKDSHPGDLEVDCPQCPYPDGGISDVLLQGILNGTDRYFRLMHKSSKIQEEKKIAD